MGGQPTGKFKATMGLALRWPAGLLEEQELGEAGSDCSHPTCNTRLQGFGDTCHFLLCHTCELWETVSCGRTAAEREELTSRAEWAPQVLRKKMLT